MNLDILLDAVAMSDEETAHRLVAGAYLDMAHRYAALGQRAHAARLFCEAERHEYASLEARAEARLRQPARYSHGLTARQQARSVAAYRGWETRGEAEHAVTVNIDPHLLPLWQRVKYQFSGTPHQRWEAFMHYVEEHPGEATSALADHVGDFFPAVLEGSVMLTWPKGPS